MNARAVKGASSEFLIFIFSSGLSTKEASVLSISTGEGKKATTASKTLWIPLFLKADPHRVGTKAFSKQPCFNALTISSDEIFSSLTYFSINVSSYVETSSTRKFLHLSASETESAGISIYSKSAPWVLSL